jgi:hypothetical protein
MVMDSTETYSEGPIYRPFSASIFVCHHNFDRYVRNCDSGPNKCDLVPFGLGQVRYGCVSLVNRLIWSSKPLHSR